MCAGDVRDEGAAVHNVKEHNSWKKCVACGFMYSINRLKSTIASVAVLRKRVGARTGWIELGAAAEMDDGGVLGEW